MWTTTRPVARSTRCPFDEPAWVADEASLDQDVAALKRSIRRPT